MENAASHEITIKEFSSTMIRYKWIFLIVFFAFLLVGIQQINHLNLQYSFDAEISLPEGVTPDQDKINALSTQAHFYNALHGDTLSLTGIGTEKDFDAFQQYSHTIYNLLLKQIPIISSAKNNNSASNENKKEIALLEQNIAATEALKPTALKNNLYNEIISYNNSIIGYQNQIQTLRSAISPSPASSTVTFTTQPMFTLLPYQVGRFHWFIVYLILGISFGLIAVFAWDELIKYRQNRKI